MDGVGDLDMSSTRDYQGSSPSLTISDRRMCLTKRPHLQRSSIRISPSDSLTILPDHLVPPTFRPLVEILRSFPEGSASQSDLVAKLTNREGYLCSYDDWSFEDYLKEALKYRIILMEAETGSEDPTIELRVSLFVQNSSKFSGADRCFSPSHSTV